MTVLRDSFDRADDPTGLGAADLGGVWAQADESGGAALFGIVDDSAYAPTVPGSSIVQATLDTGSAEHRVEASVTLAGALDRTGGVIAGWDQATTTGLVWAVEDRAAGDQFTLSAIAAGTLTPIASSFPSALAATVKLALELRGRRAIGWVDGVRLLDVPLPAGIVGTRVGLSADPDSGATRWDLFSGGPATLIRSGPCSPWTTVDDVEACCCDADPERIQFAIDVASEVLFARSGYKYPGVCQGVERPCSRRAGDAGLPPPWWRESWGWCRWGRRPGDPCGCGGRGREYVPIGQPVQSVDLVLIDGEVLDPSSYVLLDGRTLRRIDGESWPCCQDLDLPDTEIGTWAVYTTYGRPIPKGGDLAAQLYACQLAKCGSEGCELPERVQSIVRQGVSADFVDIDQLVSLGTTSIPFVEEWLKSVNPSGRRRPLGMASPDVGRRARRTGPYA